MSEKIYKSIDYVTYMERVKKLFEDAQCLLEDISPCSDASLSILRKSVRVERSVELCKIV